MKFVSVYFLSLPLPGSLCNALRLSVCLSSVLSVCLLQLYVKTTERIFLKILPQMCLCTRKNWLDFASRPLPDLDTGIFQRIESSTVRDVACFHNSARISEETVIGSL